MHDSHGTQHSKAAPDAMTQQLDTNCEDACKTAQGACAKTAEYVRASLQEFMAVFNAD